MASGFTTLTNEHLIRSNLWERQMKELLMDDLNAMKFVRMLSFSDGTTLNIPSLGEAETADFVEGQAIKYNKFDTGNFTFTITQSKYSANSISEKFKRDSYYASDVISAFVPRQHRALMEAVETRILSRGNAGQTASSLNTINGGNHRWVGSGLNESMSIKDFELARYSLRKANVPLNNLVAIVDPSVSYTLSTQTNAVNLMTPSSQWAQAVHDGLVTGMKWKFNVAGFDVIESNYLPGSIAETVNGRSTTVGVANMFFSATPGDTMPFVGCFRQMPTVYSEFNKDLQQEEFATFTEYDFALYRPENMVIVLTDIDVVS